MTSLLNSNDYETVCRLMRDPNSGLERLKHSRHVSLPWHQLGTAKVGLSQIFHIMLGRYWAKFSCVPVAIGSVRLLGPGAVVVNEHNCMHLQVETDFIVLKPKVGAQYTGVVTSTNGKRIVVKVHDIFSVVITADQHSNENGRKRKSVNSEIECDDKAIVKVTKLWCHKKMFNAWGQLVSYSKAESSNTTDSMVESTPNSSKSSVNGGSASLNSRVVSRRRRLSSSMFDPSKLFGDYGQTNGDINLEKSTNDSIDLTVSAAEVSSSDSSVKKKKKKHSKHSSDDHDSGFVQDLNPTEDSSDEQSSKRKPKAKSKRK